MHYFPGTQSLLEARFSAKEGLIERELLETKGMIVTKDNGEVKVAGLYFLGTHQPNFNWLMLHCLGAIAQAASRICQRLNKLSKKSKIY